MHGIGGSVFAGILLSAWFGYIATMLANIGLAAWHTYSWFRTGVWSELSVQYSVWYFHQWINTGRLAEF
jgi:hypothetical protein